MYLDWALLHWCFSLLCLMGAPGLPGLVGQMGREVPGPIWVLNGLSPVCLPSWFRSHVTWPCSEHSPDCTVQGVHIRCVLTSLPTACFYLHLPDPTRRASPSVLMNQTLWCTHRALAVLYLRIPFFRKCPFLKSVPNVLPNLSSNLIYTSIDVSNCLFSCYITFKHYKHSPLRCVVRSIIAEIKHGLN